MTNTMECGICLTLPEGEVHQCNEGHCYCVDCWSRLPEPRRCPECRQPLPQSNRNRVAERAIAALEASCEHCGEATTRGGMAAHLLLCPQRPNFCTAAAEQTAPHPQFDDKELHTLDPTRRSSSTPAARNQAESDRRAAEDERRVLRRDLGSVTREADEAKRQLRDALAQADADRREAEQERVRLQQALDRTTASLGATGGQLQTIQAQLDNTVHCLNVMLRATHFKG